VQPRTSAPVAGRGSFARKKKEQPQPPNNAVARRVSCTPSYARPATCSLTRMIGRELSQNHHAVLALYWTTLLALYHDASTGRGLHD